MKALEKQIGGDHYRNNTVPKLFDADGKELNLQHYHITQWFLGNDYALGCATKYIFRVDKKSDPVLTKTEKSIQDLEKSQQYITMKIEELYKRLAVERAAVSPEAITYDPINDEPEDGTEFSADNWVSYAAEGEEWEPCDCEVCVEPPKEEEEEEEQFEPSFAFDPITALGALTIRKRTSIDDATPEEHYKANLQFFEKEPKEAGVYFMSGPTDPVVGDVILLDNGSALFCKDAGIWSLVVANDIERHVDGGVSE